MCKQMLEFLQQSVHLNVTSRKLIFINISVIKKIVFDKNGNKLLLLSKMFYCFIGMTVISDTSYTQYFIMLELNKNSFHCLLQLKRLGYKQSSWKAMGYIKGKEIKIQLSLLYDHVTFYIIIGAEEARVFYQKSFFAEV